MRMFRRRRSASEVVVQNVLAKRGTQFLITARLFFRIRIITTQCTPRFVNTLHLSRILSCEGVEYSGWEVVEKVRIIAKKNGFIIHVVMWEYVSSIRGWSLSDEQRRCGNQYLVCANMYIHNSFNIDPLAFSFHTAGKFQWIYRSSVQLSTNSKPPTHFDQILSPRRKVDQRTEIQVIFWKYYKCNLSQIVFPLHSLYNLQPPTVLEDIFLSCNSTWIWKDFHG